MYIHPDFGRCGIGSKILAVLEQEAGLLEPYLKVNALLNAEAFYRKQGLEVIEYGIRRLASRPEMPCVKMRNP